MSRLRQVGWMALCSLPIIIGAVYIGLYGMNFPRWDQFETSIYAAEGAIDGTLTWTTLTQPNYGHRIVIPLAVTALLAPLTNWNLIVEAYIGYAMLVGAYVALVATLRAVDVPRPWLAALVIGVVFFSTRQRTNLIWSFTALQWFTMQLFIALAGWAFVTRRVGIGGFALTVLFTLLSMASSGGGVALLVVFPLLFWLRGYRSWGWYVAWGAIAVAAFTIYTLGMQTGEDGVAPLVIQPLDNFWFLTTWLSNAFLPLPNYTPRWVHLMVTGAGVGLLVVNIWQIIKQRGFKKSPIIVWMAFLVLYALASGAMTMLGRSDIWWHGAQSRFYAMSVFFWVAVAVSTVCVLGRNNRLLRRLNIAAIALIIVGQVYVNTTQFVVRNPEGLIGNLIRERDERCYWVYLIHRSPTCLNTLDRWGISKLVPMWDNLFERRLTLYAAYDDFNPATALMPDIYRAGEAVVVSGPHAYQQVRDVAYRDYAVPGTLFYPSPMPQLQQPVPSADLFRVLLPDVPANPVLFERAAVVAAGDTPTDDMLTQFREFVRFRPRVWLLRGDAPSNFDDDYLAVLDEGFSAIPVEGVHWRTTGYEDVMLYLREPSVVAQFGDSIMLEDWQMTTSSQLGTCSDINVRTMWRTDALVDENYSLALVLAGADGVGVGREDAPPAGYTTRVWEPEVFYPGENQLSLPCDLSPGSYDLLLGLYVPGTGDALPITSPDGALVGDLLHLTTVTVQ